jgi:hypothetical protein
VKFSKRSKDQITETSTELSFEIRAMSAVGISIIADALDYAGAPIFALPVIGDISDLIVTGLLYRLTRSKVSVLINSIEFVPFIGDFIPTYTISTLLWLLNESRRRPKQLTQQASSRTQQKNKIIMIRPDAGNSNASRDILKEDFQTRLFRACSILRSRIS